MKFLSNKDFTMAQIAIKYDEYKYMKNTKEYFETMPQIGLLDSQVELVNDYMDILENPDRTEELERLLDEVRADNAACQSQIENGSKSPNLKRNQRITAYLIRQIEKFRRTYC